MSRQRSQARRLAVQAIYQWQLAGQNIGDIVAHMLTETDTNPKKLDVDYFRSLVEGISSNVGKLDEALKPHLARSIDSVDPVERAVLRLGVYELMNHIEVPYRVVINESVELAKTFGAEQGHKFVNGVLDKASKELRAVEWGAKS